MSHSEIIHAWKDEEYRNSLSKEQRSQLPSNPVESIELIEQAMEIIVGGINPPTVGRDCTYTGTDRCENAGFL
jgi:mersacidin/lichenicidin family type 2 lantibiotic